MLVRCLRFRYLPLNAFMDGARHQRKLKKSFEYRSRVEEELQRRNSPTDAQGRPLPIAENDAVFAQVYSRQPRDRYRDKVEEMTKGEGNLVQQLTKWVLSGE